MIFISLVRKDKRGFFASPKLPSFERRDRRENYTGRLRGAKMEIKNPSWSPFIKGRKVLRCV
jgi:hypothetical protein